jgi:TolA-binding protein
MQLSKTFITALIIIVLCSNFAFSQQNSESDDISYALKLFNEEFFELAAKQFARFVNNFPLSNKVPEARYYIGLSLYQMADYENARIEFQGVAVDYPSSNRAADSWFMVGECFLQLKNDREAAKSFEMVKNLHPQHKIAAKSILRAGELYKKIGSMEKAEQLFVLIQNRYVESPEYFPAVLAHGGLYVLKAENSRAEEKLKKVLDSNTAKDLKSQALYLLGEMYRSQGYFMEAGNYFQQIITKYKDTPIYPNAVFSLARINLQQGKYNETQQIISTALSENVSSDMIYKLHEKLADSYYLNGKFGLALKHYEQSVDSKDSSHFVLRKLKAALSWQNQNNITKAAAYLKDIITNPSFFDTPGYNETKDLYFKWQLQTKQYDAGISDLYRLKARNHLSYNDRLMLAKFFKDKGDWLGLIKELETGVYSEEKFTERDEFIFEVALANENLQRYEEAARYYQKLSDEFASSEFIDEAIKRLEYLNNYMLVDQNFGISQLALLMGDVIKQQNQGQLQYQLGKIYFNNLKDYQSALVQFINALNAPENEAVKADLYHHIGLCYQRLAEMRKTDDASRNMYLQKARENLSLAMENINSASRPDLVAWDFVKLGIRLDQSAISKQIGYYETLTSKYQNSTYKEYWHAELAVLYAQEDATQEKALEHYNILAQSSTQSRHYPDYLYYRAKIKQKLQQGAIEDFKVIASAHPNSKFAAMALYNLGLIYEKNGAHSEANQIFNMLLHDYYYSNVAKAATILIGDTYLYSGQEESAIAAYENQLSSLPADDIVLNREFVTNTQKAILYKLGKAYYKRQNWNASRKNLANYLQCDPQGPFSDAANLLLGEVYLALDDPRSAVLSFGKVTKQDPDIYMQALGRKSNAYFEIGDYTSAARDYAELAVLEQGNPQEADAQARNTVALIRSGNIKESEKSISQFSKKFKGQQEYLASFQFELGDYYRTNKNFNNAVKYFERVKSKYSRTSYLDNAEYYLALTYLTLNKQNDALKILTNFPSKYPQSENLGPALNTLGGIYFRSEKYESAISSFKGALEKTLTLDQRQQVLSNLIKAYSFVNFWDAALGLAREYIETYPNAEDIIDKKILMSRAFVYLNQVDRAVELLKETRLLADSEKEPEIQFYIGDAYFKSGQYESAIAEYVKIPLLSRKTKLQWEASALYYSGQAYEKLGRVNEAVRMYAEIVKRPGIDLILKKDAQKRINQIKN